MEKRTKYKLIIGTIITSIALIKMFFWGIVMIGGSVIYIMIRRKLNKNKK